MADPLSKNLNTANMFANIGTSLFGKTTTSRVSGGGQTDQTMFSQEGINAILRQLMESEQSGLSRVASGARIPGMYNTTSQQLMINDLLARTSGEVATRTAPRVTTRQDTVTKDTTPGMLDSKLGMAGALGAGALVLASPKAREKLGIDGIFSDIGSIFGGGEAAATGAAFTNIGLSPASTAGASIGLTSGGYTGLQASGDFLSSGLAFGGAEGAAGAVGGGLFDGISSAMSTPLWEGGFSAGQAMPYLPAVGQLIGGDVEGAAITAGLTYAGSAIGGPVGGFIGSTIGSIIGGGCFITTAVCHTNNRADDCHELTVLRNFRDTWLQENHPEDIKQYYTEAPIIVSRISAREDAATIYNQFDRDYIQPAVDAISDGAPEIAYQIYKNLFLTAKEIAHG